MKATQNVHVYGATATRQVELQAVPRHPLWMKVPVRRQDEVEIMLDVM